MQLTITGDPKEIAALVVAIQERQSHVLRISQGQQESADTALDTL